jgi:beta-phosphoglucomutase
MGKGIIFDMDGVLIDAMPFHAEAMKVAINEVTNYNIDKKIVYLLEGLPGSKLVKEIFKREKIDVKMDDIMAKKISKRKKEIFNEIQRSEPIGGARELVNDLRKCGCLKAVVSGSAKQEVESILDENIGSAMFDLVITGDDVGEEKGKHDPAPFQMALRKMNLKSSEAIVVENSPLGVEAAKRAGISYVLVMNNTPLDMSSDFGDVEVEDNRIFRDTRSAGSLLKDWCCK